MLAHTLPTFPSAVRARTYTQVHVLRTVYFFTYFIPNCQSAICDTLSVRALCAIRASLSPRLTGDAVREVSVSRCALSRVKVIFNASDRPCSAGAGSTFTAPSKWLSQSLSDAPALSNKQHGQPRHSSSRLSSSIGRLQLRGGALQGSLLPYQGPRYCSITCQPRCPGHGAVPAIGFHIQKGQKPNQKL